MIKKRLYLRCETADRKAREIKGCPDVGVEHLGMCYGFAITEDRIKINSHTSSTLDFLRSDLMHGIDKDKYEVIDLIDSDVERMFK